MKFKKKPVVVEAVQWTGTEASKNEIVSFVYSPVGYDLEKKELKINTLEGIHTASNGDWIIKGIAGEFYPCKPDIFEKTYENYQG